MQELVTYESQDHIATITLNRPEKRNALNPALAHALQAAWRRFEESDDRCAVLAANGPVFSAGIDLREPPEDIWAVLPGVGAAVTKPVVACVQGACIGSGSLLVAFADLAVLAEDAVLHYPEPRFGVSGALASSLVGRIPHKLAMEFILLSEPMPARRALEVGLANRVVPRDRLADAGRELATTIATSAPMVISLLKRFSDATLAASPPEQAARTRRELLPVRSSEDRREGARAHREKREPVFRNR
jgi:enoyl-CoA hydratase